MATLSENDPIRDFRIEAWTLYGASLLIIMTRIYARWKIVGFRNFKLDDYLMVLAIAFDTTLNTLVEEMMAVEFTNSNMDDATRAALTPEEIRLRAKGSMIWMAGWCTYASTIWTLKFSMIAFFSRLMTGIQRQRLIKWAFWSTSAALLALFMVFFLTCRPFYKVWQSYPNPGPQCMAQSPVYFIAALTFNVSTDIFIISIPLPVLWNVRITPVRKAMMMTLFSGGIFVMLAASLRCYFGLKEDSVPTITTQWTVRESFVSILIGNAPMIKPLFSRESWGVGKSRSSKKNTSGAEASAIDGSGYQMRSKRNTQKSITDDADFETESTEHLATMSEDPAIVYEIKAETEFIISSSPAHTSDLENGRGHRRDGSDGSPGNYDFPSYSVVIEGAGATTTQRSFMN